MGCTYMLTLEQHSMFFVIISSLFDLVCLYRQFCCWIVVLLLYNDEEIVLRIESLYVYSFNVRDFAAQTNSPLYEFSLIFFYSLLRIIWLWEKHFWWKLFYGALVYMRVFIWYLFQFIMTFISFFLYSAFNKI